jgi:hypothetical protein
MRTENRWKEFLLSLAAGQSMVPFGDNRATLRLLAQRVSALRKTTTAEKKSWPRA